MLTKLDLLKAAELEAFRQKCIVAGMLESLYGDIKYRMQNWRYYEGKKRTRNGRVYNLLFIRVDKSEYRNTIKVKAVFLLDKVHLREGAKLNTVIEIERWSGFTSSIPVELTNRYKDIIVYEEYEAVLQDLLNIGVELLEVK